MCRKISIGLLMFCSLIWNISVLAQNKDFDLEIYFNRSISNEERASIKEKIYNYSQQIHADPNEPYLYINRGVMYANLGLFPDAISDYNKAIKLNDSIPEAYYNRGIAKARFAYTKAACLDIKKSAELGLTQGKDTYNKKCGLYIEELGTIK